MALINWGGEHARQPIHAGLICLNSDVKLTTELQIALFEYSLELLDSQGTDLINQALEVSLMSDDSVRWLRYAIPAS